jgi:hypothetical protein
MAYGHNPARVAAIVHEANDASDAVLIAGGALPHDPEARRRHHEGLMDGRIAAAAAVVLAAVPPRSHWRMLPPHPSHWLLLPQRLFAAPGPTITNLPIRLADENMNEEA